MSRIDTLTELLAKFPGIGRKTALRYVFFLLKEGKKFSQQLSTLLADFHEHVRACKECGNLSEAELCPICMDPKRNRTLLCVVAQVQDIIALEYCQNYFGVYHVLGGLISPLDRKGPEHLSLSLFQQRIATQQFQEIILATPPTLEGEVTARYILDMCRDSPVKFTRIAQGMPKGGDFEYTDKSTLAYALEARAEWT